MFFSFPFFPPPEPGRFFNPLLFLVLNSEREREIFGGKGGRGGRSERTYHGGGRRKREGERESETAFLFEQTRKKMSALFKRKERAALFFLPFVLAGLNHKIKKISKPAAARPRSSLFSCKKKKKNI